VRVATGIRNLQRQVTEQAQSEKCGPLRCIKECFTNSTLE